MSLKSVDLNDVPVQKLIEELYSRPACNVFYADKEEFYEINTSAVKIKGNGPTIILEISTDYIESFNSL